MHAAPVERRYVRELTQLVEFSLEVSVERIRELTQLVEFKI